MVSLLKQAVGGKFVWAACLHHRDFLFLLDPPSVPREIESNNAAATLKAALIAVGCGAVVLGAFVAVENPISMVAASP